MTIEGMGLARDWKKGGGQHHKAQNRGDAEIGPQPRDPQLQHLGCGAEGHQDLPGKEQHNQSDDAGDPHRQSRRLV